MSNYACLTNDFQADLTGAAQSLISAGYLLDSQTHSKARILHRCVRNSPLREPRHESHRDAERKNPHQISFSFHPFVYFISGEHPVALKQPVLRLALPVFP